ncbi:alpha/beta hydrolase [Candidatus Parcubacteria bacterium]|nr:alpha/beta hydrolase [Candidatus Parcubacteria bacterium]
MDNPQTKISEKQIQINGLNINYKTIGDGKIPIVLLHGWGVSSDKYTELIKILYSILNTQYSIFILDLPGFGKSDEPKENWNLDDYVEFVDEFIKKTSRKGGFELVKNILEKMQEGSTGLSPQWSQRSSCRQKLVLIGHSFGGRIAIKYAVKCPEKIDKLILTGAAGIKRKLTVKQKIFFILAKIGKKIFSLPLINNLEKYAQKILYKATKEKDYYQASPRMKEVMKNVLDEDLTDYLDKIKNHTLLVWGKEDKTTPLADGKIMNEKIENSKLIVVDDANHSLPYQKAEKFVKIVEKFIKK